MSKADETLASVAQRLEELALETDNGELQALADELGAITLPDVNPGSCKNCAQGEKFRRIMELMFITAMREGFDAEGLFFYRDRIGEARMDYRYAAAPPSFYLDTITGL